MSDCKHEWDSGEIHAPFDECPYCRIAVLEQENIEFIDVNIYEHSAAEKAKATIKRVQWLLDNLEGFKTVSAKRLRKALGEAK